MVYFTCGDCGEQIKKPSVEKHYQQKCRNCNLLTCIDCLKDFYGDEYKAHNQCMTEDQRYSKEGRNGYDPTIGSKGEMKQLAWIGKLRGLLESTENIDKDVRGIVDTILNHENVPRKRPKFVNFVKNIMRNKASVTSIDKTWDLFSQALKPSAEEETKMENSQTESKMEVEETKPGKKEKKKKKKKDADEDPTPTPEPELVEESRKSKKKKKKEKHLEEPEPTPQPKSKKKKESNKENTEDQKDQVEEENKTNKRKLDESMEVDEPSSKKTKFDWDETISSLLSKGEEIKLNKLKKKCVSEFFAQHEGTHKTAEEVGAKFDKKIKKKKYRILKDKVKLIPDEQEEEEKHEQEQPRPDQSKDKLSFNKWEATNLGNDAQTEKFRRLMGIKTDKPPQAIATEKRDDRRIFKDLEDGFERARQTHFKAKGLGLGFS
ncbi:cell growth-regulating nucleolar protein [Eurytemora carolleeae]|uniref:cell growth-regulating nucleolar protein n=1 Tax=Eurytemora carolleeae TaxID=1294199 RepID=UPI000C77E2DE|nr:cell growth-regulating nucleolar protein [Eurytemora carolleeae]|eukprot:XP_023347449.1 cell growth-regulating nucleolar protein-like [Eurytemora affinis]